MARKKKRKGPMDHPKPKPPSPNQQRVYFMLDAANVEGGCIEREMIEGYKTTFGSGTHSAEMALFRQIQSGYINREEIPDTGPLFSHRLTTTELGSWWVIASGNPQLSYILRRRRDIHELVKVGIFRIQLLEAMDDEIKRLLEIGLEISLAPPSSP